MFELGGFTEAAAFAREWHAPTCPALGMTPCGKTWRDMPGVGEEVQKMNFFFFRRGMLDVIDTDPDTGKVRTRDSHRQIRRNDRAREDRVLRDTGAESH